MKKLKYLLAVLLMVMLCGCQKEKETRYLGILRSADQTSGLIVYLDEDYQETGKQECINPLVFYQDEQSIYISENGSDYQGYGLRRPKQTAKLSGVVGYLLVHNGNSSYYALQDDQLVYHDGLNSRQLGSISVMQADFDEHYLYLISYDNHLHVYRRDKAEEVSDNVIYDSVVGFGRIKGQTCLATSRGIAPLKDGQLDYTFLYPVSFSEVENIIGERIYGYEGEEQVVYIVSLDGLQMHLELEKDEIYYRETDLDELFRAYQSEGWRLVNFIGLGV